MHQESEMKCFLVFGNGMPLFLMVQRIQISDIHNVK